MIVPNAQLERILVPRRASCATRYKELTGPFEANILRAFKLFLGRLYTYTYTFGESTSTRWRQLAPFEISFNVHSLHPFSSGMSGWGGGYRSQPDRNQAASSNRGGRPPPFHYVHPLLRQLLDRTATLPPGNPETFSEATLAAAIYLAIEMAEDVEQVAILSRIIPEEELARERLARPDVRDLTQEVIFTSAERREVIRDSPEPEEDPVNANAGDCVACGDPGTARMICGCLYCLPCLRRLVRLGLRPDGEFPPRCCDRPLTEATVRLTRRPELVHLFRQLAAEAAVPVFERTYCHDESCATFIPPHRNGVCPICRLRTCPICRGSHEPSARCPEGGPMEDVWQTLDRNNIVNCPQCGRLIQRNGGCNQMRWVNSPHAEGTGTNS